ncbi:MAG: CDP-alcohol phosphatidyltransferase family protein [Planctomycetales bacterium]|nr:CDP-alcohol phosphatidyltransferase family protein [Planctomycetales bacterium]
MTSLGIAGVVCCVPHIPVLTVCGAASYFLFDLLDAVDGELARWHGESSIRGLYLDQLSHLLVDYLSLGVPALHVYVMSQQPEYAVLAAVTTIASTMGRGLREMMFRINAEAQLLQGRVPDQSATNSGTGNTPLLRLLQYMKMVDLLGFPVTKARIVHLATILTLTLSYLGVSWPAAGLAWFYACYCVVRTLLEMPYYYHRRIMDLPHQKATSNYRWPL